jgi:hypothetical protein
MDSCYVPFHTGNAGFEQFGETVDRPNRLRTIWPMAPFSSRGVALHYESKFLTADTRGFYQGGHNQHSTGRIH